MTTATWDDLVAAALLGTERRTPPGPVPPGRDPCAALLDTAAINTVQRRAGLRPAAARALPDVAPADPRAPLPDAARARLALLLAERAGSGRGNASRTAPDLSELLPEWLRAARAHGYRAPEALLPALLDAARARTDLRPEVLAFGGPRALWLARLNPDWKFALRGAPGGLRGSDPDARAAAAPGPPDPCAPSTRSGPGGAAGSESAAGHPSAAGPAPEGGTGGPTAAGAEGPAGGNGANGAEGPTGADGNAGAERTEGPAGGSGNAGISRAGGGSTAKRAGGVGGVTGPEGPAGTAEGTVPAGGGPTGSSAVGGAARRQWEEGLFTERVSVLVAARRSDPAAGLALLESTWPTERAEDRLAFVDALRDDLVPADEPFLERALADRSRNVRATAAELLSALPGSALAARMSERARRCVLPGGGPTDAEHGRVVVRPPDECDSGMQRDGVVVKPPVGCGERAWWFSQVVETAPLDGWIEWFGGRGPDAIVALPVSDGWQAELYAAWCRAAVRQRSVPWARALLGDPRSVAALAPSPADPPSPTVQWDAAKLLAVLPPADRAGWLAEYIPAHGLSDAFRLLGVCTVPWSAPLGRAVVDALDIARDGGSYPWSFSAVMGLAERCLDPAEADRLEVLTALPDESDDAFPGAAGYWSEAFARLVSTLRIRTAMLRELAGPGRAST